MISDSSSQVRMMTAAPISLPRRAAAMVSGVLPLWQARQMMEFLPKSFGVLWTNSLLLTQQVLRAALSRSISSLAGYSAPSEPPQPTK